MTVTPTQLTLRQLRADGWPLVEVVERWLPAQRIRKDLFGFVDVIAVGHPDRPGPLLVQATSATNVASRVRKIADHPNIGHVRDAGCFTIEVWGWGKKGHRWQVRKVDVT